MPLSSDSTSGQARSRGPGGQAPGSRPITAAPIRRAADARPAPRYPIESVDNALNLLRLLPDLGALSVAEAAEHLGVARSTAHRLLAMLQHHDLVQQEPVLKTYVPGPALVSLGLAALRDVDIRGHVLPYLELLVAEVGETAHFVVRRDTSVIFLDCAESRKALRAGSRTGQMLPAHCTASGKVLLAELGDDAIRQMYPAGRLPGLTARSVRTRKALLAQLAEIRERGYAINLGESEEALSAVAVMVTDQRSTALGAITIAGPSLRFTEEAMPSVARAAQRQAAAITAALAGSGLTPHRGRNSVH